MRDIGNRGTVSVVDVRPDEELPRPANDNYQPIDFTMQSFERGKILKQHHYDPAEESLKDIGLIAAACFCAIAIFVLTLAGVI